MIELQVNNDEIKIGELPELEIIAIDDIIMHEFPDVERAARLIEKLSTDRILRNPPIVARIPNQQKRILLDGHNRITALTKLDVPHVMVQEIEYFDEKLKVSLWHHAVEFINQDQTFEHIEKLGLKAEVWDDYPLADNLLCRIVFANNQSFAVVGSDDLYERVIQLKEFTDLYHNMVNMDRVSYTSMDYLLRNHPNFSMLVSFPRYTKENLLKIINRGLRIPTGVTRFILPKRALQINTQLDVLRAKLSVDDKNTWLRGIIREKIGGKHIRFYREPTFFFDE